MTIDLAMTVLVKTDPATTGHQDEKLAKTDPAKATKPAHRTATAPKTTAPANLPVKPLRWEPPRTPTSWSRLLKSQKSKTDPTRP